MTDTTPTTAEIAADARTAWLLDALNALTLDPADPLAVHAYGARACLHNLIAAATPAVPLVMPPLAPPAGGDNA